jgi:hypothetical protein
LLAGSRINYAGFGDGTNQFIHASAFWQGLLNGISIVSQNGEFSVKNTPFQPQVSCHHA